MTACVDRDGDPLCYECRYCLRGLPPRGLCPECGRRYSFDRLTIRPGARRNAVVLGRSIAWVASVLAMTWRSAAIVALVVGNSIIIVALANCAYRRLTKW